MSDSQYDKPTTLAQADRNIAAILRSQKVLRSNGKHAEAAEWDTDLAEQRAAREAIRRNTNRA